MKLSKLYCNQASFKTICFNDGFNVIIGEMAHPDQKSNTHNLGKTKLIDLIDFMLLKAIHKKHFFNEHLKIFNKHCFFLELKMNSGKYLTIKRAVENNTKISIKKHDEKHQNFSNETNWDCSNLDLTSKKGAKYQLNTLLGFDVLKDYSYRQTINYFLRTQNDYTDVFKLTKHQGTHKDWKPVLFDLLGKKGSLLLDKYEHDAQLKANKKLVDQMQQEFLISTADQDETKAVIQAKESEKKELQAKVDAFDFYEQELEINQELVEDIEKKVADQNSALYKKTYEKKQVEESLKTSQSVKVKQIEEIFNEATIYFPDQLKKNYNELEEFNLLIGQDRKQYLQSRQEALAAEIKKIKKELSELNKKRKDALSKLEQKDVFEKFKAHQKTIAKIDQQINQKLEGTYVIQILKNKQKEIESKIREASKNIEHEVNAESDQYEDIRTKFTNFTQTITHSKGIISMRRNKNGNVDFECSFSEPKNANPTSQADGSTYKKVLCACFDLSILLSYMDQSFFKFIFHDAVIESQDDRLKKAYIKLIRDLCDKHDMQYIMTLIDNEHPLGDDGKPIKFHEDEVALKLTDEDDGKGSLFGFKF